MRGAFRLGRDRVLEGDPKYALRILVDIALRALSPGLHEPTIAILALDQIESFSSSWAPTRSTSARYAMGTER